MEGDDREPSARGERLKPFFEPLFERSQLVVDRDPQGLKGASGWMDLSFSRHCILDNLHKLAGSLYRLLGSLLGYRPSDPSRITFFTITIDYVGKVLFAPVVYDHFCGKIRFLVHCHQERFIFQERKSPSGAFQLVGRESEIEENSVNFPIPQNLIQIPEVFVVERNPFFCRYFFVLINSKDFCSRISKENFPRVSAAAKGSIQDDLSPALLQIQAFYYFI